MTSHEPSLDAASAAPDHDVTALARQRDEAMAAGRQSEERFRMLFESSQDGIVIKDETGRYLHVNQAACELLGYDRSQLLSMRISDLRVPEGDVSSGVQFERYKASGHTRGEFRFIRPDGQTRILEYSAQRVPPNMHLSILRDVTEVRHAAEEVRSQQERLRAIFDSEPECVKIVSPAGLLMEMNAAGLRMIGAEHAAQVIGHPVINLVHPHDRPAYQSLQEAVCGGKSGGLRFRIVGLTGVELWMETNAVPLRGRAGEAIGMLAVTRDITAQRKTELELARRADLERLLFRELDHRVRNNLSSLISLIDITRRRASDVGEFASTIRGRVEVMGAVHSLLSRSHWAPLHLRQLVEAITPGRCMGAVAMEGEDVLIQPRQVTALGMVIHELVMNSLKYGALTTPGGRVSLHWQVSDADPNGDRRLRLRWQEAGGLPIWHAPVPGSGTQLILGLTQSELRGEASLTYPIDGAAHELEIQLDSQSMPSLPASDQGSWTAASFL